MSRSGTPISAISDGAWPQSGVGVLLWSVSVSATDWQTPEKLTRLCTIPVNEILQSGWDSGSLIMEARILKPLIWFGLLEYRAEKARDAHLGERHFYRKTPMFDRFLTFNVHTEQPETTARH